MKTRLPPEANIEAAWQRVKSNRGMPGIDGMSIGAFPDFARKQLPRRMQQIREGRYRPAAVKEYPSSMERMLQSLITIG